jgi:hypothetical protein
MMLNRGGTIHATCGLDGSSGGSAPPPWPARRHPIVPIKTISKGGTSHCHHGIRHADYDKDCSIFILVGLLTREGKLNPLRFRQSKSDKYIMPRC